jgi:predicted DNA-binding transcriptional regulator YafY
MCSELVFTYDDTKQNCENYTCCPFHVFILHTFWYVYALQQDEMGPAAVTVYVAVA